MLTPGTSETGTILIVDDMMVSLKILENILEDAGYQVRCAKDGMDALESIEGQLPELLLLDIQMPGIDGYEVCRQLKSDDRTRQIPIIFLSALDDDKAKVKGFEVGGADFITKPYNPTEILYRIKTHLSLSRMHYRLEEKVVARTAELSKIIEEQKRTEAALRKNVKHFRMIFEKAPLPMIITDGRYRIVKCNDRFQKLSGFSRAEIAAGKECWQLWYPDDLARSEAWKTWEASLAKSVGDKCDIAIQKGQITAKDGGKMMCEFHTEPLGDYFLFVINDVSVRKLDSTS